MRIISIIIIFFLLCATTGFSQVVRFEKEKTISGLSSSEINSTIKISWNEIRTEQISASKSIKYLSFDGARYVSNNLIPSYVDKIKVPNNSAYEYALEVYNVQILTENEIATIGQNIMGEFVVDVKRVIDRKRAFDNITIVPFRMKNGVIEKLISFRIVEKRNEIVSKSRKASIVNFTQNSILASGTWYKIGVDTDGMYKIDKTLLESLGINISDINVNNFRVYGNGGGMLPANNDDYRADDLLECAIITSSTTGTMGNDDYFLFYGQGPNRWVESGATFTHKINMFTDTTFYFINFDIGAGKRIQTIPSTIGSPAVTVNTFSDFRLYEKEAVNLIKSGKIWYGEEFNVVLGYDFNFTLPNIDVTSQVSLKVQAIARSITTASSFDINVNGLFNGTVSPGTVVDGYTEPFGRVANTTLNFTPNSDNLAVSIDFSKGNSSSLGWLDYIEINARRKLIFNGGQLLFRDLLSVGNGLGQFDITSNGSTITLLDITSSTTPVQISTSSNGSVETFNANLDSLREFCVFDGTLYLKPAAIGTIENQNLHATPQVDYIIITHKKFLEEAQELADFHEMQDTLSTVVVTVDQIYNEYSSGAQDITGIRDFIKMFYERSTSNTDLPKYVLLFGDGSYDPKYRMPGNTNYVPSYHSTNSLTPTNSYVSDDYFGLLDPGESNLVTDIVDVGIGRLPVKTSIEAQNMVNKVKSYYKEKTMRSWRNWLTFIGDDEDSNIHMRDVDRLAMLVDTTVNDYNIDKIYLDAYPQTTNAGGDRYPDVEQAIHKRMELGSLILTYVGHGGELGWAHERILEISGIGTWQNIDNMPLYVTATCEFSRYDDPARTSAGEYVLLNPDGGAIALLTTTRLVYSSPNYELAKTFFENAFVPLQNGEVPRLGDLCRLTKANGPLNVNSRNFTLLGDPAIKLAYPKYEVVTTQIPDTIKALSQITIKGEVRNSSGIKINDFNGDVYPTIFDKPANISTLNNDGNGVFNFKLQKNVIFKGKASVTNGTFQFSFVVPKDIDYEYGIGRISYYVENDIEDGNGYDESFIIGDLDSLAGQDLVGPEVDLYMNDKNFVFGGMTDQDPEIYAILEDENGINTVGIGIGHDIMAVLDEKTANAIQLNEFYESDLDSYKKGSIRYKLADLEDGQHTLSLKVWDVYNNSGEGYTEFVVADNAKLALSHVLNYPNPFTTNTDFYFEHNQPGNPLSVRVQIFTVSGKLVKEIRTYSTGDSFRVGPINWDGRDDFGDKIGRGVYVYQIKVIAPTGETVDKFEKLVILN